MDDAEARVDFGPNWYALQWGHGRWAVDDSRRFRRRSCNCRCFNGATADGPWMTNTVAAICFAWIKLQWGHGRWAVDDETRHEDNPRLWDRLQWGHRRWAVDDGS